MIVSSLRLAKFTAQNFWRNFWLSLITVSMLVLTLLTINILLVLQTVGTQAAGFIEDRIEVSVYFKTDTEFIRTSNAAEYLRGFAQVRDVQTISADDALARFRERHAGDDVVLASLEEVGENPFGPTLVIRANSVNDFPFILDLLDNPRFRDDIRDKDFSDYEALIEKVQSSTQQAQWFAMGLAAIFLLIALLIIFNTVRMSIFIHANEISVMKLVGASNWFVRAPFLLESVLYSFLATVVVLGVVFALIGPLESWLNLYFETGAIQIVDYFYQNGLVIFGLQFIALSLISMISTSFAMRKYLNV